ncbi:hypothetical protein PMAYCL1PPCAC_22875, partial [Pristionchus mayeri]
ISYSSGFRIYLTIQSSAGSNRSKVMERSAFRLLLSQAINPLILLHIPSFLNFFQATIFMLPEMVNRVSCIFGNIFPVSNPLLNVILSRDLSNSLKSQFTRRRKSSIAI